MDDELQLHIVLLCLGRFRYGLLRETRNSLIAKKFIFMIYINLE
jgi:hypothetical protein